MQRRITPIAVNDQNPGKRRSTLCNSIASVPLLAPTWAQPRAPLHTSTTATPEASLPIAPQKPRPLQSEGNNHFKVSEQVTSPIETLLARTTASHFTSVTYIYNHIKGSDSQAFQNKAITYRKMKLEKSPLSKQVLS